MDRVEEGDVIFHYAKQCLQSVSIVVLSSRPAARPYARSDWDGLGREIRVTYQDFDVPIPLAQIPPALRARETQKNSPFSSVGKVNVGYLWDLSDSFAIEVLKLAGMTVPASSYSAATENSQDGTPRQFVFALDATDGLVSVTYRKEQPKLRSFLFKGAITSDCEICRRTFPVEFLVTAHIKPRSRCNEYERRDENVVFAACVFGCDALFESGRIYVDANGTITSSQFADTPSDLRAVIDAVTGMQVHRFGEKNSKYFGWHRSHRRALHDEETVANS